MKSYNTLEGVRNYFIPLGFHEYKPSKFDNEGICTCFQKRYDDDVGKKYFIDAKIWNWSWTDKVKENYHPSMCCQVYQKDTHEAVNFEFIDWELDNIENWLDDLFSAGFIEHYERWDD